MYRAHKVFQHLLAPIEELGVDLALHLAECVLRDTDATRLCNRLEASGNVDTIAENISTITQNVTKMNTDAPFHPVFVRDLVIALGHHALKCNGALHSAHHRGKLDQDAIAGRLDNPPAMLGNEWIGSPMMLVQQARRTRLISFH